MTIQPILLYPDPRLSVLCDPVVEFDADLHRLAADLLDTMRAAPGVGITAAHVGVPKRLFVLELPGAAEPQIYVNPEILWFSAETIRYMEGSVSMPGVTEEVERPRRVRLRWQDLNGQPAEAEADDFHAVCIQHEVDQLDGIFWIRRLSRLKRDRLVRRWRKEA